MNFKRQNTIIGWLVFITAFLVYLFTMEKTASFWDSGEFIAAADKLQIVHPPGAPIYLMIARLFSWFLPDHLVAFGVNMVSAISTAIAAMFVFWSTSIFAQRLLKFSAKEEKNSSDRIAIFGSALVAAFAFVFQDSQWFNAAEAEVYALSTAMTASVIWMALKWSEEPTHPRADRWLLGISLVIGISLGVHLLNLLAIPAIALLYYFHNNEKITTQGGVIAFVIGMVILLFVQYGVILQLPKIASGVEVLFVNTFHLPFNIGIFFFFLVVFLVPISLILYSIYADIKILYFSLSLLLIIAYFVAVNPTNSKFDMVTFLAVGLIAAGIYYFQDRKQLIYTSSFSFLLILLGYLSFLYVPIRSAANTPIDINNPDNVFSLLSYLNREQYGDKPLLYGPIYTAEPIGSKVVGKVYQKKGNRYEVVDNKIEYEFDRRDEMLFPRMWLFYDQRKVDAYGQWIGKKGPPSMLDNIGFFLTYQLDYMYWRYFMWNFAGRQNNVQGQYGTGEAGNWASGISFVDKGRVAQAEVIPNSNGNNRSVNHFYLLPFVFGILGLLLHYRFSRRDFWVNLSLFILTGVAIVVYLNQDPLQPRERDYAYVGSFLSFAIWIGLAVVGLYKASQKMEWKDYRFLLSGVTIVFTALILMGFGTNNPSTLFGIVLTVLALAFVYFAISIGFKNGSKSQIATLLTVLIAFAPIIMAFQGWDDHNRNELHLARATGANYLTSTLPNAILFTEGDNDTYPLWYAQEVEQVRPDVRIVNNSLLKGDWYVNQIQQNNGYQPGLDISFAPEKYESGKREVVYFDQKFNQISLQQLIQWIDSDSDKTYVNTPSGKMDTFPAKNFSLAIDKDEQVKNQLVEDSSQLVDTMFIHLNKNNLVRDEYVIYDIIQRNINKRPIYFTGENLPRILGLTPYLQREGFSMRLLPVINPSYGTEEYSQYDTPVNLDKTLHYTENEMDWGNVESNVYLEETGQRQILRVYDYLAKIMHEYAETGEQEKAKESFEQIKEHVFTSSIPTDDFYIIFKNTIVIDALLMIGEDSAAMDLATQTIESAIRQIKYVQTSDLPIPNSDSILNNMIGVLESIQQSAKEFNQNELLDKMETLLNEVS